LVAESIIKYMIDIKNIFSQKTKAFGLDISDLSLKIADLEKIEGGLNLVSFGSSNIPPEIIEEGKVKDENALSEIIKKAVREVKGKKIKTKYVVASLPEEKSFLDVVRIPSMAEEEIESAVRYEIENYIPVKLEEVYFDFERIESTSKDKTYQEVLITALPKEIVEGYLSALKRAGLQPVALEVECLSIARALIKKDKPFSPLLIIDFGETRTTFIIFSGKSLRFTSTIPVSSQKLTESISNTLKVDLKKAEEFKIKHGLEGEKAVFEAMIPPLTDLVEQIKTHLDYYHSHEKEIQPVRKEKGEKKTGTKKKGNDLNKILLCGGGANLKGLVSFLASNLKIKVELGNPWVNILKRPLKEVPELPFEQSLGYTTALGLALRGIYGD